MPPSRTPSINSSGSTLRAETADNGYAKAEEDHVEAAHVENDHDRKRAESYYHNFAPIAELNLPDWRQTEKRLVRVLDMTLLPTLWILYLNNYLDRTNIAQARLNTINEDLGLTGDDYNTAVAVLTVGYMLAQLPSNMLLTRVRPGIYLPVTAIVWSAVSAATAGTTSPQTLFVVRFFLGILEAPLFPGVSLFSFLLSLSLPVGVASFFLCPQHTDISTGRLLDELLVYTEGNRIEDSSFVFRTGPCTGSFGDSRCGHLF